jgi:hypothetical protein
MGIVYKMGHAQTTLTSGLLIVYAICLLIATATIDYVTGYELQFFVFYFLPISIAALHHRPAFAYSIAVASALCWFAVDIESHHPYTEEFYRYWNTLIRMSSFLLLAGIFSTIKQTALRIKKANDALAESHAKIKVLQGVLPICASCKRIRDKEGNWEQMESYVHRNSEADFTHGLCPQCVTRLYPEMVEGRFVTGFGNSEKA